MLTGLELVTDLIAADGANCSATSVGTGERSSSMRVLVYSPVRLFGEGLATCLCTTQCISSAAAVCVLERLYRRIDEHRIDIVLFDITGKRGLNGARALAENFPEVPIVALAIREVSDEVIACADAGLVSYVPRQASLEELVSIIDLARDGRARCSPEVTGCLLRELRLRRDRTKSAGIDPQLTCREAEIFHFLGRGWSNKRIAIELNLSVATVKNHVHNLLGKLNVGSRFEAQRRLRNEPWLARSYGVERSA